MDEAVLDRMIAFATEALASEDSRRVGALVRTMALRWPRERALTISFALTAAASGIEDMVTGGGPGSSVARAYKLAALVAADVLAIETAGRKRARANDLLLYWRRADPYFLDL